MSIKDLHAHGMDALETWLAPKHTRVLRQFTPQPDEFQDCVLELLLVQGKLLVVQQWKGGGWDVFVSPTQSIKVDETLAKLDEYLAAK